MTLKEITPQDLIAWIEGLEPNRVFQFTSCTRCVFGSFYDEFHKQKVSVDPSYIAPIEHTFDREILIDGWKMDFQRNFRNIAYNNGHRSLIRTEDLRETLPMLRALAAKQPSATVKSVGLQTDTTESIIVEVDCSELVEA